jgi:hypothetical protein
MDFVKIWASLLLLVFVGLGIYGFGSYLGDRITFTSPQAAFHKVWGAGFRCTGIDIEEDSTVVYLQLIENDSYALHTAGLSRGPTAPAVNLSVPGRSEQPKRLLKVEYIGGVITPTDMHLTFEPLQDQTPPQAEIVSNVAEIAIARNSLNCFYASVAITPAHISRHH